MELTAKTLVELIRALRSDPDASEKRKHPRVGLRAKTKIARPSEPGEFISIAVREVSASGIGFSCSVALKPGEEFKIILTDRTDGNNLFSCTAIHSREVAPDLYVVGARFNDFPSLE